MTIPDRPIESNPLKPGTARDDRATVAASDAVDVERLLPGEEPSGHPEDIEHWIAVYSELLDFKRFMLDGASARVNQMATTEARTEIESTDLRLARAEAERFTRRLAFWRSRQEELNAQAPLAAV
jgi:hypothetical protein